MYMFANLFLQFLLMSYTGGIVYLIIKLIQPLTIKHFSPSWHYYLHIAIYSFLLIPCYKCISWFGLDSLEITKTIIKNFSNTKTFLHSLGLYRTTDYIVSLPYLDNLKLSSGYFGFLSYLWIVGVFIFVTIIFIHNYQLYRNIFNIMQPVTDRKVLAILTSCSRKLNIKRKIPVYILPYYKGTPYITGIFKPLIILPSAELSKKDLKYIFYHELTHWKRKDLWLKSLLSLINALHWFNPLSYIAKHDIDRFCELSCDEKVTKLINKQEKIQYAELILKTLWNAVDQKAKLFPAFGNQCKKLDLRIDMILKNEAPQSRKWISPLLSTVILLAVFITIFTVTTITNVLANTPINLTKNIEQINEGVSEEAIEPSPERRAELERILKFEPWKVDDISGTH